MPSVANSNIASLVVQRDFVRSIDAQGEASSKSLPLELRVNPSADDAFCLSVSDRMKTRVRGFNQAVRRLKPSVFCFLVELMSDAFIVTRSM